MNFQALVEARWWLDAGDGLTDQHIYDRLSRLLWALVVFDGLLESGGLPMRARASLEDFAGMGNFGSAPEIVCIRVHEFDHFV